MFTIKLNTNNKMINEKFESFQKNKNLEFSHKNLKENLKIVVENTDIAHVNSTCKNNQEENSDLLDYEDIVKMEEEDDDEELKTTLYPKSRKLKNTEKSSEDGEIDIDEEDETEFHVNLDKVPPTLQNTILVSYIFVLVIHILISEQFHCGGQFDTYIFKVIKCSIFCYILLE